MQYILALDQATSSTRTIVFGPDAAPLVTAQQEFKQIYPHPGWIEHDPRDLWQTTLTTMREALAKAAGRFEVTPAARRQGSLPRVCATGLLLCSEYYEDP